MSPKCIGRNTVDNFCYICEEGEGAFAKRRKVSLLKCRRHIVFNLDVRLGTKTSLGASYMLHYMCSAAVTVAERHWWSFVIEPERQKTINAFCSPNVVERAKEPHKLLSLMLGSSSFQRVKNTKEIEISVPQHSVSIETTSTWWGTSNFRTSSRISSRYVWWRRGESTSSPSRQHAVIKSSTVAISSTSRKKRN